MGVSKNSGTPKWMVYKENLIKMDDLGVPLFLETPICFSRYLTVSPWHCPSASPAGGGPPTIERQVVGRVVERWQDGRVVEVSGGI